MVRRELGHPATWAGALATAALGSLGAFGPAWQFVVSTKATWFFTATVFGSTLAPRLGEPWSQIGTNLAVFAAVLAVSVSLVKLGRKARERALS